MSMLTSFSIDSTDPLYQKQRFSSFGISNSFSRDCTMDCLSLGLKDFKEVLKPRFFVEIVTCRDAFKLVHGRVV
jgi:hypothetical protein